MRCLANLVHSSFTHALIFSLLSRYLSILNRKLRRHHSWLVIIVLSEHRLLALIPILINLLILLLLIIHFKVRAVVKELTIVVIVSAVAFTHILIRYVVFCKTFIVRFICMLGIFGLAGIAMWHVISFLKSVSRVIVFLDSTNGVFYRCGKGVFLVSDS